VKIADDVLLAGLVTLRLNDFTCVMPRGVRDGLIERGWIEVYGCVDIDEHNQEASCRITDAGQTASDLFAPEIGVNPCPVAY
jgi:hypothetical protein